MACDGRPTGPMLIFVEVNSVVLDCKRNSIDQDTRQIRSVFEQ